MRLREFSLVGSGNAVRNFLGISSNREISNGFFLEEKGFELGLKG